MGYSDWDDNNQPAKESDHDWQAAPGDFDTIPIIDVGGIRSNNIEERQVVATKIRDACTQVGFFYIENHGISQALINDVFRYADKFFALSYEQKMELFIDNSPNFRGYTPVGASGKRGPDGKGNLNESFQWGHDAELNDDPKENCTDPHMKGPNRWPQGDTGFKECMSTYYCELRSFCRLLARTVALSLGLTEDYFQPYTSHPGCAVVLAHYPPQQRNGPSRGLDAHTDSEFFTILAPGDVRALEVANKSGRWISAPPKPGTFIVNVGDQLQAFTNDLYISTRHRVMNYSGEDRISVPFFFSTNFEAVVKPIPELISGSHVAKYPPVPAGKMYYDNMALLHRIASIDPEYSKFRPNSSLAI